MDRRENIRDALAGVPRLDIVLDDASHASHHQQYGFLELFPRLAPGGLYIIEDLRWQPPALERTDFVKTADLFQGYLNTGAFAHPDPDLEAELNALRPDISGCFVFQAHFRKSRADQVAVVHKR